MVAITESLKPRGDLLVIKATPEVQTRTDGGLD